MVENGGLVVGRIREGEGHRAHKRPVAVIPLPCAAIPLVKGLGARPTDVKEPIHSVGAFPVPPHKAPPNVLGVDVAEFNP